MNEEAPLSVPSDKWWVRFLFFLFGTAFVWLARFLTITGLVLAAAIKNDQLTDWILPHYPRYKLAMDGMEVLRDMKYPAQTEEAGKTIKIGVLEITDPAWQVLFDFVKSETAIRKSERNDSPVTIPSPTGGAAGTQVNVPPINFNRIKTIDCIRLDVARAGPKSLVPPFSLNVMWPAAPAVPRRVYEFLSFEELQLDLRQMMAGEVEAFALWLAVIAFLCELPAAGVRYLAHYLAKRRMAAKKDVSLSEARSEMPLAQA